jgi:hypothetical protein
LYSLTAASSSSHSGSSSAIRQTPVTTSRVAAGISNAALRLRRARAAAVVLDEDELERFHRPKPTTVSTSEPAPLPVQKFPWRQTRFSRAVEIAGRAVPCAAGWPDGLVWETVRHDRALAREILPSRGWVGQRVMEGVHAPSAARTSSTFPIVMECGPACAVQNAWIRRRAQLLPSPAKLNTDTEPEIRWKKAHFRPSR